ncbi:MAG: tetratricopeptide repeat protein, partial [Bacillota bacterium]
LSICPDEKTKQTLQIVKSNGNKLKKEEYICHKNNFEKLQNAVNNFLIDENKQSYIVFGEAGIGKTTLLNHVSFGGKQDNLLVLKTFCFQAEERYYLKPWKYILQQLENKIDLDELGLMFSWRQVVSNLFPSLKEEEDVVTEMKIDSISSNSLNDALIYLFSEIAKKYKLVFIFEDLHWADKKTLFLIKNLLYSQNKNIMLIATSRNSGKRLINNSFSGLYKDRIVEKLELKRLSFSQIKEFSVNYCGKRELSKEVLNRLYEETEGNLFFLVEYLNLLNQDQGDEVFSDLTSQSKNILRNRIQTVSQESLKILKLISIFFTKISYNILVELSNKSDLELIKIIEELKDKYLIKEIDEDNGVTSYLFTHSKIRDFIYNEQSTSRRKILHERIACVLEKKINNENHEDYTRLIYHYSRAGNKVKHLKYLIHEAEIYFNYTHELYPVARDRHLKKDYLLLLRKEDAQSYLDEINNLIEEIEVEMGETEQLKKFHVKFLHMRFYYLVGEGQYDLAVIHIKKMISEAKKIKDFTSIMKGYEELAIIGIQIEDFDLLEINAQKLDEIACDTGQLIKKAIARRLLGVVNLYRHDFTKANKFFRESLQLFEEEEILGKKFTLSKAALYNYLGEVQRRNGNFKKAFTYYKKAITMCEKKNIVSGLGTFYTNKGIALFHNGEEKKAESYFKQAVDAFDKLPTVWGYSVLAFGYLSLIMLHKGNSHNSCMFIKQADQVINKYPKRYWEGLLYWIKGEIAEQIKDNNELKKLYKGHVIETSQFYRNEALEIFNDIGTTYEKKLLET